MDVRTTVETYRGGSTMLVKNSNQPANRPVRMNSQQAADYLGVPKTFLERDRFEAGQSGANPKIAYVRLGHRSIRYNLSDLDAYLQACRVG